MHRKSPVVRQWKADLLKNIIDILIKTQKINIYYILSLEIIMSGYLFRNILITWDSLLVRSKSHGSIIASRILHILFPV